MYTKKGGGMRARGGIRSMGGIWARGMNEDKGDE